MVEPSGEYNLQSITAQYIMEAVEAGCNMPSEGVNAKKLQRYANISLAYARRALTCAVQLGMMVKDGSVYRAVDSATTVSRASKPQWPTLFGRFLVSYSPFVLFVAQIARGDSKEAAARKVAAVYEFSLDETTTRRVLVGWGTYANLLEEIDDGLISIKVNVNTLDAVTVRDLLEAMKSELNARVYITNRIGDDAFLFMDDSVRFLVSAVLKHQSDPRNSIEDAGKALEDFLRLLCEKKGVDTSRLNGIGAMTRALFDHGHMLDKHRDICGGINAVRIAAAHGLDKKTQELWNINAEAAMETALLCFTMVQSLFQYVFKGEAVL